MKRFKLRQRVRVVDPLDPVREPLRGRTGSVSRMRRADDMAWVTMDADLPDGFASFPANDDRHRHIILAPEECEAIKLAGARTRRTP